MHSNKYSHNWKNQSCWNTDVPCAISIGAPKKKKIFAKNNLKIKGAPNSVRVADGAEGIGAPIYSCRSNTFSSNLHCLSLYIHLPSHISSSSQSNHYFKTVKRTNSLVRFAYWHGNTLKKRRWHLKINKPRPVSQINIKQLPSFRSF
jgi:hypothetical protein